MGGFNWTVLILPILSIIGLVLMYWYFRNKTKDKPVYDRYILVTALTALVLNLEWELLHAPLYEGYRYDWPHVSMCMLASVTDMLTTLIMLFGLGLFYENIFWACKLKLGRVILIVLTGGTGTILLERWHIAAGHWQYAKEMPMVPWIGVGLTPLLQFTVLPIFVFLTARMLSKAMEGI